MDWTIMEVHHLDNSVSYDVSFWPITDDKKYRVDIPCKDRKAAARLVAALQKNSRCVDGLHIDAAVYPIN